MAKVTSLCRRFRCCAGKHALVIDGATGVHVCQSFERQAVVLICLCDPTGQRPFNDAGARPVETGRELIELFSESHGHMGSEGAGFGFNNRKLPLLITNQS